MVSKLLLALPQAAAAAATIRSISSMILGVLKSATFTTSCSA